MASATLHRADGSTVAIPRIVLLTPTTINYDDGCGNVCREPWSPVWDRLEYRSPGDVIAALEAALARATGQPVAVIRLAHGYDGP
jgi:hypothetical protein